MYISWQTVITASAVIAAIVAIVGYYNRAFKWVEHQNKQSEQIAELHDTHNNDISSIKSEQTLIIYGLLACLKGLSEQGCNGPVTEAINKIEKHLNQQAHK